MIGDKEADILDRNAGGYAVAKREPAVGDGSDARQFCRRSADRGGHMDLVFAGEGVAERVVVASTDFLEIAVVPGDEDQSARQPGRSRLELISGRVGIDDVQGPVIADGHGPPSSRSILALRAGGESSSRGARRHTPSGD